VAGVRDHGVPVQDSLDAVVRVLRPLRGGPVTVFGRDEPVPSVDGSTAVAREEETVTARLGLDALTVGILGQVVVADEVNVFLHVGRHISLHWIVAHRTSGSRRRLLIHMLSLLAP